MKKIIKKSLGALLIASLFGVGLASCGLVEGNSSSINQEVEKERETIYRLAVRSGYEGTYEEWLDDVIKFQEKEYAESKNKVPGTTFFTIRESDNKIVGMVNLRHYLNDYLKKFGGHIGYGIRPAERRKGYAKIQLYLTLLEAQKLGIDKVMVDCINTNTGSEKTILALGGEFDREVVEEDKNVTLNNYWIDVDKSIEKYRNEYEQYITEKGMVKQ